jgi:hypothetical protein
MEDDTTEEPSEECQEIKRNFDGYVDPEVESMGERVKRTTKNVLFRYGLIECQRRRRGTAETSKSEKLTPRSVGKRSQFIQKSIVAHSKSTWPN